MNVYDFDETVFHPDSSFCFFRFCLRHRTLAVSKCIPASALQFIIYLARGRQDAQKLKEALFSYLNRIDNVELLVQEFWARSFDGISSWYLQQKQPDDVIISASPEFLLRPAADRLGVRLIATPMNPYTGKIIGRNCHDHEKVRRFREQFPEATVDEFYSDSLSDTPLARLAVKAFLVKGNERNTWPSGK